MLGALSTKGRRQLYLLTWDGPSITCPGPKSAHDFTHMEVATRLFLSKIEAVSNIAEVVGSQHHFHQKLALEDPPCGYGDLPGCRVFRSRLTSFQKVMQRQNTELEAEARGRISWAQEVFSGHCNNPPGLEIKVVMAQ